MFVQGALNHLKISSHSFVAAVQDVGDLVRSSSDPTRTASNIFKQVLDVDINFHQDPVLARVTCSKMIEQVVKAGCQIDDVPSLVSISKEYAEQFCDKHPYLYSKKEVPTTPTSTIKQVVQDVDVKVAVNSDGSIKKGGKQQLAVEMYKKYVTENEKPLTNQQFIAVLMKELEMSKAGATTYAYNCKKVWI